MSDMSLKANNREFDNARQGLREMGGSDWEREIVDLLARHGAEEGELLYQYERLGLATTGPAVRYVTQLILDDERRHHRMLVEMANAVAWSLPAFSPQPAVPALTAAGTDDEGFDEAVQALLAQERKDHDELKKLRKRLHPFAHTTLLTVLVDVMLLDTQKHIRLLEFLAHNHGRRS